MIGRRDVLKGFGAAASSAVIPLRLSLASAPGEKRLVVVVLRGGLDGLAAVPPHGDPLYFERRPTIAVPAPGGDDGALDLDGYFGLHPALAPLLPLYEARELVVVEAATTGYRQRSHFDGQNLLENGLDVPSGSRDGWLNRALAVLQDGDRLLGLSIGHTVPLLLRGEVRVRTWAPSVLPHADPDFLERLAYTYRGDPLFRAALAEGRASEAATAGLMAGQGERPRGLRQPFAATTGAAGALLAEPGGARIAVLEAGGWDTHFNQANRLASALADLAEGLVALQGSLGGAWAETVVAVVSEFGRTVAENGSRGTDHGVGGIALLLGGAVAGGRVAGRWPGLSDGALYEGRDLMPTSDYRSVFKGLLADHLGVAEAALEERIFPDSRGAAPMPGLVRSG